MSNHKSKGFTLIELIIFIVIIGILAALAIPRFMRATEVAEAKQVLTSIKYAEALCLAETCQYTDVLDSLKRHGFQLPDYQSCTYTITVSIEQGVSTYIAKAYREGELFFEITPTTAPLRFKKNT